MTSETEAPAGTIGKTLSSFSTHFEQIRVHDDQAYSCIASIQVFAVIHFMSRNAKSIGIIIKSGFCSSVNEYLFSKNSSCHWRTIPRKLLFKKYNFYRQFILSNGSQFLNGHLKTTIANNATTSGQVPQFCAQCCRKSKTHGSQSTGSNATS